MDCRECHLFPLLFLVTKLSIMSFFLDSFFTDVFLELIYVLSYLFHIVNILMGVVFLIFAFFVKCKIIVPLWNRNLVNKNWVSRSTISFSDLPCYIFYPLTILCVHYIYMELQAFHFDMLRILTHRFNWKYLPFNFIYGLLLFCLGFFVCFLPM